MRVLCNGFEDRNHDFRDIGSFDIDVLCSREDCLGDDACSACIVKDRLAFETAAPGQIDFERFLGDVCGHRHLVVFLDQVLVIEQFRNVS